MRKYCDLPSFSIDNKSTCFLKVSFLYIDWIYLLIFIIKNTNADTIFFSILQISLILIRKIISLKSNSLGTSLSIFLILAGFLSTRCKYLIKHYFKNFLLPVIWILIKPFLDWSNAFDNLISFLPLRGLYFKMLIACSVTESVF